MDEMTHPPAMTPRIALLACTVFEREIALLAGDAPHIVETRFFEIALHDRPDELRAKIQVELDSIDARDDIDAVVLAMVCAVSARRGCGRGVTHS